MKSIRDFASLYLTTQSVESKIEQSSSDLVCGANRFWNAPLARPLRSLSLVASKESGQRRSGPTAENAIKPPRKEHVCGEDRKLERGLEDLRAMLKKADAG